MVDEIFDRTYQQGREEMNAGLDRGLAAVGREFRRTLDTLHRIQWSAPWTTRTAKDS